MAQICTGKAVKSCEWHMQSDQVQSIGKVMRSIASAEF